MRSSLLAIASGFAGVVVLVAACGASDSSVFAPKGDGGDGGGGGDGLDGSTFGDGSDPSFGDSSTNDSGGGGSKPIASLAITPAHAALTVEDGQTPPTQAFQVIATYDDGTSGPVQGVVTWSDSTPQIGAMNGGGVFTASGLQGGELTVTAASGGKTGTATLDVKLHALRVAGGGMDPGTQTTLRGATTPDGAVKWAYPYDKTVFPRGLNGPELQWIGGADADLVYVHLTSPYYDFEAFGPATSQRFTPTGPDWTRFVDSTTGDAELKVTRLAGGTGTAATVLVDQHWSIAPGSMRGTIYYWAIDTGRVMRITPGATNPDDLFGAVDLVPPQKGKCVSCHSVSANGQRIVVSAGHWSDTTVDIDQTSVSYDFVGKSISWSGAEVTNGGSAFSLAGISADGKVMVQNFMPQNFAPDPIPFATSTGAFDATTGALIPNSGLDGKKLFTPVFSPDDKVLVYATGGPGDLHAMDWDPVARKATNDRLVVASGTVASKKYIQYPTVTPDHQYVLYQRGPNYGSEGIAGDLYMAPVAGGGPEVKLAALDGDAYPFAAANRDRHLDYEPTFAPVASGGKYWVVFHSRRTYGNELTNPVAYGGEGVGVKQLWVAAIDQNVTAGVDPSHPAFHLPGQSLATFNMRGYWALEPCRGDGAGCASGTECCGGYCASAGPGSGAFVCAAAPSASSGGCAQDGDRCASDGDCCKGGSEPLRCINSVCSVDVIVK